MTVSSFFHYQNFHDGFNACFISVASLLSCLHQLKMENQRLEDHVVSLAGRRDHLLAVNARLSLSLGQQHQSPNSPRINTVASVATPFLHLQAPSSQDSSHVSDFLIAWQVF